MDELQPMTFVVTDERNAPKVVAGPIVPAGAYAPGRVVGTTAGSAAYVRAPHPTYAAPTAGYGMASYWGSSPVYQTPPAGYGMYPLLGGLFGNLTIGDLIEIFGDAIAAFKKRPDAPQPSGDLATDMSNLVSFMAAYADHTDTKDRIRIARDVGKVLGAR